MNYKATYFPGILILLLLLSSCGANRKNFIAKSYHNTTTHYNYYYNGEVKWKEGVGEINAAYRVPTQGFIPILYTGREEDAKTFATHFEEAIKKCETAILKHPNSKWIKNCRYLMGRSWFYRQNYSYAIQNLDFVVKNWPDARIIPDVHIWRAKCFYKNGNRLTAQKVLDKELKGVKLSKKQQGEITLLQAQMLLDDKNYDEVVRVLEKNRKLIHGKNNRARVHFLLGQLYAAKGSYDKALENFKIVSRMNTDYEFVFQAKIKMARLLVERDGGGDDQKTLTRLLKKMLRDEKNIDYRDQIYYELALLELKEPDQPAALEYLKKSLRASTTNQRQKALSYYKTGQIYFYEVRDYEKAGAYFDSASATITKDAPEYREIANISKTLKEFVRHSRTIHLQDSLLELSTRSEKELIEYCKDYLEQKRKAEEARMAKELEEMNRLNDPNLNQNTPFGTPQNSRKGFYFDQQDLVSSGRVDFERVWGKRPNEDNWRRKNKEIIIKNDDPAAEDANVKVDSALAKVAGKDVALMMANIPRTPEARDAARLKIQEAYYGLGQIFKEQLNQPDSAIRVFNTLIERYPSSDYALKAKYSLYKIYSDKDPDKAQELADQICRQAADSRYCKLVRGLKVEEAGENEDFRSAYTALWNTYNNKDYSTCIDFSRFISSQYLSLDELANVYYIRGMSYGYMGNKDSLRTIFQHIRTTYPDAEITPTVIRTLELMGASPAGSGAGNSGGTPASASANDPRYKDFNAAPLPNDKFVVLLFVEKTDISTTDLQIRVNEFNRKFYAAEGLNCSVMLYKDYHQPYISQFNTIQEAESWMSQAGRDNTITSLMDKPGERMVFISTSNFRVAYGKKRMEDYFAFYENVLKKGNGK